MKSNQILDEDFRLQCRKLTLVDLTQYEFVPRESRCLHCFPFLTSSMDFDLIWPYFFPFFFVSYILQFKVNQPVAVYLSSHRVSSEYRVCFRSNDLQSLVVSRNWSVTDEPLLVAVVVVVAAVGVFISSGCRRKAVKSRKTLATLSRTVSPTGSAFFPFFHFLFSIWLQLCDIV